MKASEDSQFDRKQKEAIFMLLGLVHDYYMNRGCDKKALVSELIGKIETHLEPLIVHGGQEWRHQEIVDKVQNIAEFLGTPQFTKSNEPDRNKIAKLQWLYVLSLWKEL